MLWMLLHSGAGKIALGRVQPWCWKFNYFWVSYNDEQWLRSLMLVEQAHLQDNVNGSNIYISIIFIKLIHHVHIMRQRSSPLVRLIIHITSATS